MGTSFQSRKDAAMSSRDRGSRSILLLVLLIALAAGGAYLAYEQGWVPWPKPVPTSASASGSPDLKAALDELDHTDPGWRFDELNARRAEVPPGENSAD